MYFCCYSLVAILINLMVIYGISIPSKDFIDPSAGLFVIDDEMVAVDDTSLYAESNCADEFGTFVSCEVRLLLVRLTT